MMSVEQRWVWNDRTHGCSMYVALPGDICDTYSSCGAYASVILKILQFVDA